jgi:hypothetical protein
MLRRNYSDLFADLAVGEQMCLAENNALGVDQGGARSIRDAVSSLWTKLFFVKRCASLGWVSLQRCR